MRIILLGPPGSGKGLQARIISEYKKIPAISIGEMLRKIASSKTPLGEKMKS